MPSEQGVAMKIDQNPFSIYDFLGYLIPGLFFTYASIFVVNMDMVNPLKIPTINFQMDQYFVIVILSYMAGHILSFLSSVTIEIFSIWTLGYPSRYLLKFPFPGFWHNILKDRSSLQILIIVVMIIFIFPVIITDLLTRKLIKTSKLLGKSADDLTITLIKEKIPLLLENKFNIDKEEIYPLNKDGNDFFNIIYHYSLEECPTHVIKMQNYVALYGFLRTMCFSIISLIWIVIINGFGGNFSINAIIIILILTAVSGVLYLDFNKFFRKFSLESFMAFLSRTDKLCRTITSR